MDMVNISVGTAAIVVVLGMCVVFLGLILLMFVVQLMSRWFIKHREKEKQPENTRESIPLPVNEVKAEPAPGSAGELKLYDTDPRDAALIMAIVADELKTPLNELRFKSIREIRE